jgi:hypothetical protein
MKHLEYAFSLKAVLLLLLAGPAASSYAQDHSLQKLWETDTIVAVPESVLPDMKKNILYVSLVDGGPWDADGKGGVGRLTPDGKHYEPSWITGLNAPKGMGIYGDRLYVADISEVVVVNIPKASIEKKIPVPGATGLNDITVDDKGAVYVSDTKTARVWKIEKDHPTLFLKNMVGANGLKAIGKDLYVLSGKSFVKAAPDKQLTPVANLPENGDGLEPVGNGDFLATAWIGYIYYVRANGQIQTLLDTHLQKKNTADIGYDPKTKIVYVPGFFAKTVGAYLLK